MKSCVFRSKATLLLGLAMCGFLLAVAMIQTAKPPIRRLGGPGAPFASSLKSAEKEIYGEDDRIDVYQETDPDRLAVAKSVCGFMYLDDVLDNEDGTYSLDPGVNFYHGRLPGEDVPFQDQPLCTWCTGFVVGTDLVATAGHCINERKIDDICVVFGFEMADAETPILTLTEDQVYLVDEVIAREEEDELDFAIVRVDRPITAPGAVPLPIRREGRIPDETSVGIIGHPLGMPLKITFGPETRVYENVRDLVFVGNFDGQMGDSGAPVFNQDTLVVEGIHYASTNPDLLLPAFRCYYEVNRLDNDEAAQLALRTTAIASYIPEIQTTD